MFEQVRAVFEKTSKLSSNVARLEKLLGNNEESMEIILSVCVLCLERKKFELVKAVFDKTSKLISNVARLEKPLGNHAESLQIALYVCVLSLERKKRFLSKLCSF